jgi:hypothetical protein
VENETAGDPESDQIWQRSSLRHLSVELTKKGHTVSHTTVERLLKKLKYSLKANVKRLAGAEHPDRNTQFEYIERLRKDYIAVGSPVISVDTKKKELIGNFKNVGRGWCQKAEAVNDHDFDQDALGKAVPYGIYDLAHNLGYVYVGKSADTPEFAVSMIASWWQTEGGQLYPGQTHLLILADVEVVMVVARIFGNNKFRSNWPTSWDWKLPCAITPPERRSGIRWSIVYLGRSVLTGQVSHCAPLRSCQL